MAFSAMAIQNPGSAQCPEDLKNLFSLILFSWLTLIFLISSFERKWQKLFSVSVREHGKDI
jgi:hypothetical protein